MGPSWGKIHGRLFAITCTFPSSFYLVFSSISTECRRRSLEDRPSATDPHRPTHTADKLSCLQTFLIGCARAVTSYDTRSRDSTWGRGPPVGSDRTRRANLTGLSVRVWFSVELMPPMRVEAFVQLRRAATIVCDFSWVLLRWFLRGEGILIPHRIGAFFRERSSADSASSVIVSDAEKTIEDGHVSWKMWLQSTGPVRCEFCLYLSDAQWIMILSHAAIKRHNRANHARGDIHFQKYNFPLQSLALVAW